jgi:hypothetical protein
MLTVDLGRLNVISSVVLFEEKMQKYVFKDDHMAVISEVRSGRNLV